MTFKCHKKNLHAHYTKYIHQNKIHTLQEFNTKVAKPNKNTSFQISYLCNLRKYLKLSYNYYILNKPKKHHAKQNSVIESLLNQMHQDDALTALEGRARSHTLQSVFDRTFVTQQFIQTYFAPVPILFFGILNLSHCRRQYKYQPN